MTLNILQVVERHFTLDKQQKGTDHKLSLEPAELRQLISCIRSIETDLPISTEDDQTVLEFLSRSSIESDLAEVKMAMAPVQQKHVQECEMPCRLKLGKSLVYRNRLTCGMTLSRDDICAKVNEPFGISAEHFDDFIGKTLTKDVMEDDNLSKDHFL